LLLSVRRLDSSGAAGRVVRLLLRLAPECWCL
uniref:Uncharacterized protein n=1 Tax=Cucumis melo TaxID=3656 RepID=A0A9I9E3Y4_CUCME